MNTRRGRALVSLLTALVALGPISTSLYVPSMPALARDFAVDAALIQRSFTIFLVGFAVAQLGYGPLADRFGRRPVLVGGLLLYIAATLACALSTGIWEFLAARLVQGVGACVGPVVGRAVVRDRFERVDSARAFAFIGTAIALAPALGPMIGGFLEVWFGWQSTFLFLVGYGLAMLWIVFRRLEETVPGRDESALEPLRLLRNYAGLLRNRRYLGYLAPGCFAFGGLFAYTAAAPFLFVDRLGFAPDVFGLFGLFTVTGYAFGSWLGGRLQGRISGDSTIRFGLAALVAGALLMTGLSGVLSPLRVLVPTTLFVFGFGLLLPASSAEALYPFPRIAGSASALMGFAQMAVGAAGSVALSAFYDGTAAPLGAVMLAVGAIGASGFLLMVPFTAAAKPGGEG